MTIRNLEALLVPKAVALIGASPRAGSVGATIARNLLESPFAGPVRFINPHHTEIFGRPCYRNLDALPEAPDLAVVATPPTTIPAIAAALSSRGCRAILVITAGLDADIKQRTLDAGRADIVRVLGPNSLGLMLPPIGLNATFAHRAALPGDLAFLSQSGALITGVIDWASARSIGFSHVVSLGDMCDVDFGDLLDYLAGDIASRAILLYMEAVTHPAKFLSAARRAARAKPVIIIKSGRHAIAARAAASHTGRLAGADGAYAAAFRRAGVLRVTTLQDLFEAAEMLARMPRLSGERVVILTNGGGAGVLAADHLADHGGTLAELSPQTRSALDRLLPATWSKGNPVDVIGDASPQRYAGALEHLLSDAGSDIVLALQCPTALASGTEMAEQTLAAWKRSNKVKPLITNWLGSGAAEQARALFARERIPTFETPAAAVRGIAHVVGYARAQDELMRTPPAMPEGPAADAERVERVIGAALAAGRTRLSEAEGKELLAAYGIPVAETLKAASVAEAADIGRQLLARHEGIALKILSPDIVHKSDVGGVRLDLSSPAAVASAAEAMLQRAITAQPEARIDGFTLSAMIRRPQAHELICGMSVDDTFGPLMMFGAGGVSVEAVADTSLALPPLDLKLARDLISRTRVARLLAGYRDRKPADIAAIAQTLVQLSALVSRHAAIRELDINPLLADDSGVIALDARVTIADPRRVPRTPLVIEPYPSEWERTVARPDGREVQLRPIRPEDEALYADFAARLVPEDIRLRLFAPKKELSHAFLARLTQIDYAREMAFVALANAGRELLGVSRLSADPDYERAEYAVIVRSDLKGQGLGWMLMEHLIAYARATGLKVLEGSVMAENTTMLRMCQALGFRIAEDPDDPSLRLVQLDLTVMAGSTREEEAPR